MICLYRESAPSKVKFSGVIIYVLYVLYKHVEKFLAGEQLGVRKSNVSYS